MGANYRYPGSRPFTGEHRDVFFGRDDDIRQLSTLVNVETTTVLYGKSGLGKSSLLNAGLLPHIQAERTHLVVPIRLGAASEHTTVHPLDILEEVLQQHAPAESFLSGVEHGGVTTWELLKNIAVADPERRSILLVFDQFEELFTYAEGVEEFAEALGSVLYNRMPKALDRVLRLASARNPEVLTEELWEILKRPMDVDVLVSIRSDRMSLLERLSSEIPTILHNCYELKPLSREQATTAIEKPASMEGDFLSPPFTYQPATIEKILDFLTQQGRRPIETFQLQIFCEYAEQNVVVARNDDFVEPEDLGDLEEIYQSYYDTCIRKVAEDGDERSLREFVEEGLIFADEERRVSLFEGQIQGRFGISDAQIQKLVDSHLIRAEPHASGGFLYELCHDTLVGPILKAKERRRAAEAEEARIKAELLNRRRRKKKRVRAAWFGGVPAAFALVSMAAYFFAHRNDLDIRGLSGARWATTYETEVVGSALGATLSQKIGDTRLTVTGLEEGTGMVVVRGSDGSADTLDVDVMPLNAPFVPDTLPGDRPPAACYASVCSIANREGAARDLNTALWGVAGPLPDSVRLRVPVGRKAGEPNRWRPGLGSSPTVTLPDTALPGDLVNALVDFARGLEFSIGPDDTRTYWEIPVVLRLRAGGTEGRIAVSVGGNVMLNLALDPDAAGQTVVGPGGLRWQVEPGSPWRFLSADGDTLATGPADASVSRARFAADGRRLLVASTRDGQIQGVPYTLTSYADANRITVGVGPEGTLDSTFVLNAGGHATLNPAWAGRVLDVGSTAGITVVETTRYWWQEVTEATQARAVQPLPADPGGTWEYWVPYVDTFKVPGQAGDGASSTVLLLAPFDGTTVEVDFEHDGARDSLLSLERGSQATIPVGAAGAVVRSNRPLGVTYQYRLTDWTTYEDGWLSYEIPPSRALGTDYHVAGDGRHVVVLATRNRTRLTVEGEERQDTTLSRGEQLRLPPGGDRARRIRSDQPVMVAVAAFAEDRHDLTYAYVVPASTDTLFYVPAASPQHYPSPADSSRLEVLATEDSTWLHCGGDSVLMRERDVHACPGRLRGVVRASRPVSAVFISEVEGTDVYTGDRRRYAYAHPVLGASGAGTRFLLRPFGTEAVEGYRGGTSTLRVLDEHGRMVDSLFVDGIVLGTGPGGGVGDDAVEFRVAIRDPEGDVHVYTVGDSTSRRETDELRSVGWVAFTESGEDVLLWEEDGKAMWKDPVAGTVDTIPCATAETAWGCEQWSAVDIGGDGRLLIALRDDGTAELWATACLRDEGCRLSGGPIPRLDDLLAPGDASPVKVVDLSEDGRYVSARSSQGGTRLLDLNVRLPGAWSIDRVLLGINTPILGLLGILLVLAWPVFFLELIWGVSVLDNLRRRAEEGERGFLAGVGRWLS